MYCAYTRATLQLAWKWSRRKGGGAKERDACACLYWLADVEGRKMKFYSAEGEMMKSSARVVDMVTNRVARWVQAMPDPSRTCVVVVIVALQSTSRTFSSWPSFFVFQLLFFRKIKFKFEFLKEKKESGSSPGALFCLAASLGFSLFPSHLDFSCIASNPTSYPHEDRVLVWRRPRHSCKP